MQLIYCIIHRCLYSLLILLFSSRSVSKKQDMERILTLSYSYKWQKFSKMNKKTLGYQTVCVCAEYVIRQIKSLILQFILR